MYDALIAFIPKDNEQKLTDVQIKSLLAWLNSTFIQYYIETHGRRSGGGIIGLEVNIAKEMPILDVWRLNNKHLELLASKFDELEAETRRIDGASDKEQIKRLKTKIYEIDSIIGKIIGLSEEDIKAIQAIVKELIERRVLATRTSSPKTVKSEGSQKRKARRIEPVKKLDEFI